MVRRFLGGEPRSTRLSGLVLSSTNEAERFETGLTERGERGSRTAALVVARRLSAGRVPTVGAPRVGAVCGVGGSLLSRFMVCCGVCTALVSEMKRGAEEEVERGAHTFEAAGSMNFALQDAATALTASEAPSGAFSSTDRFLGFWRLELAIFEGASDRVRGVSSQTARLNALPSRTGPALAFPRLESGDDFRALGGRGDRFGGRGVELAQAASMSASEESTIGSDVSGKGGETACAGLRSASFFGTSSSTGERGFAAIGLDRMSGELAAMGCHPACALVLQAGLLIPPSSLHSSGRSDCRLVFTGDGVSRAGLGATDSTFCRDRSSASSERGESSLSTLFCASPCSDTATS